MTYFESEMSLLPGIHLPLRSMLVRLGDDAVLISPLGTDAESAVARQTRVMLVAPSLLHHLRDPDAATSTSTSTSTSRNGPSR